MQSPESVPRLPRSLDHKETMKTLGAGKERLTLIILKHPGVVKEMKEVSDVLPALPNENGEQDENEETQFGIPRPSKRLKGNRRIIENMEEAIRTMGWDEVVEYLERNLYRMVFNAMAVNHLKDREYLDETGGQYLYCEAQRILGFDEETMVQRAGELGISMPSRDINKMSESTILNGFFDHQNEAEMMSSNPAIYIQMQQRTPEVRGFGNMLRANIHSMYFDPDKVLALRRKMKKAAPEAKAEAVPEELADAPESTPQAKAVEISELPKQKGSCRRTILLLIVLGICMAGAIGHYRKEIRPHLEHLGLGYLLDPWDRFYDRLQTPDPLPPTEEPQTPPEPPAAVDSTVPTPPSPEKVPSPTPTPETKASPKMSQQFEERLVEIQSKDIKLIPKLKELYQLRDELKSYSKARSEDEEDASVTEGKVEKLILEMEAELKEENGIKSPQWY